MFVVVKARLGVGTFEDAVGNPILLYGRHLALGVAVVAVITPFAFLAKVDAKAKVIVFAARVVLIVELP